jgi:hypothetical protein
MTFCHFVVSNSTFDVLTSFPLKVAEQFGDGRTEERLSSVSNAFVCVVHRRQCSFNIIALPVTAQRAADITPDSSMWSLIT